MARCSVRVSGVRCQFDYPHDGDHLPKPPCDTCRGMIAGECLNCGRIKGSDGPLMGAPRRCPARHPSGVQCVIDVTELTTHETDHKAPDPASPARSLHWTDSEAVTALGFPVGGARNSQVGGEHYAKHKIQMWDIWQEYGLNAFEGAVLKYLLRRKGSRLEDLKKARHTLDRLIEIEEAGDGGS